MAKRKYASREEYLAAARERARRWRQSHPNYKGSQLYYHRHAEEINARRRERYHSDPEFRERCKELTYRWNAEHPEYQRKYREQYNKK